MKTENVKIQIRYAKKEIEQAHVSGIPENIVSAWKEYADFEFPDNNTEARERYEQLTAPLYRKVRKMLEDTYLFPDDVEGILSHHYGSGF